VEKYTKKATSRILKEVLKYREKISGNTTFDQAYVILLTEWDMECGVEKTLTRTRCDIYRDKKIVHTFEWSNEESWSEKNRDWNWDFIYKTVLEHIIKTRLYKRPKTSKRSKTTK
jgi:hypothetical protein